MKYIVRYWVEGFGGQKEYFETLEQANYFIDNVMTSYAEDVEIIEIKESE